MKQKFFFIITGIIIIIFSACKKDLPTASFTHSSDSYEQYDTVNFTSTSSNADNFDWGFGDGSTSTEENPWHVFNTTGSFEVKLKVSNADGSDEASSSVTIKDPTILAFLTFKSGTEEIVSGCEILLYDNQTDFENIGDPIAYDITDNEGYVVFYNAKAIVYYLYAYKEETGGSWFFGGSTPTILLNEINDFTIPVEWFPDEKKSGNLPARLMERLKK